MSPFATRLRLAIARCGLFGADDRVAVAVSGGADSVALTLALAELAAAGAVRVAGLIHVNHQLRGADADGDEAFCRNLAAQLGWPIDVGRVDVAARAKRERMSIEVAARRARYEHFDAAATTLGATVVATAHTADDQAETVLMRLLRGAGLRGIAGIRPRRGRYARPMLDVRRASVMRYLASRAAEYREDASNRDLTIPRNRLRHELMPAIERLAPAAVRAIGRAADLARDDDDFLTHLAANRKRIKTMKGMKRGPNFGTPEGVHVVVRTLRELPAPVSRRLIRIAAERAGANALSARHVEAVRALAASARSTGRLDLPRLRVERQGDVLRFAAPRRTSRRSFAHELRVPGRVRVPETGDEVVASTRSSVRRDEVAAATGRRAMAQAAAVVPPLTVRSRQPGDRLRPLGAPGRRKLQDLMVDRKIPREARDDVPIVVDATGRIVWVAGLALADECRVTAPEAGVLLLELKR